VAAGRHGGAARLRRYVRRRTPSWMPHALRLFLTIRSAARRCGAQGWSGLVGGGDERRAGSGFRAPRGRGLAATASAPGRRWTRRARRACGLLGSKSSLSSPRSGSAGSGRRGGLFCAWSDPKLCWQQLGVFRSEEVSAGRVLAPRRSPAGPARGPSLPSASGSEGGCGLYALRSSAGVPPPLWSTPKRLRRSGSG
jgi:hypothetical protein